MTEIKSIEDGWCVFHINFGSDPDKPAEVIDWLEERFTETTRYGYSLITSQSDGNMIVFTFDNEEWAIETKMKWA